MALNEGTYPFSGGVHHGSGRTLSEDDIHKLTITKAGEQCGVYDPIEPDKTIDIPEDTLSKLKILKGGEDGKISAFDTVRSRKRSVKALAAQYEQYVVEPERQTVGIAHAACREDAELLMQLIQSGEHPPKEILLVDYEPVTGAHVGPGALALFFESCPGVRAVKGLDTIPEKVREFFESAQTRITLPKSPVQKPAHV